MTPPTAPTPSDHVFQAPTGTRDLYPADLNRLRFIQDAWRRTSIAHGFDEIDGPTFEHLDLYTVKSGEGIVSELFSFERFGGEKKFALRPEFTPTLARMFAAKAGSLPKPTKWFWTQNCFRAERPQRGRLREFFQWNCDIMGDDSAQTDAELIACCVGLLADLGLRPEHVRVRINNRRFEEQRLAGFGVAESQYPLAFALLDRREKRSPADLLADAAAAGMTAPGFLEFLTRPVERSRRGGPPPVADAFAPLWTELQQAGIAEWCEVDPGIARGLAYYTGMVFEVHEASVAERAIAGGGRYDRLIEMFGGPPTPAVGFGMGDVVLSLVLQDKGLMPSDDEIASRLGLRPDVFLFAAENKEQPEITRAADAAVAATLARLRTAGIHARRSYKSTRNIGKLLGDATKARARFALIVETGTMGQLKDLASGEQTAVALEEVAARIGGHRTPPAH